MMPFDIHPPHDGPAIMVPRRQGDGTYRYRTLSFQDLHDDVARLAAGLQQVGVRPGMRIVLLVPFNADFIALVFAILRTGAVLVLIDPGMGPRRLLRCLADVEPDGFVTIPRGHAVRWWHRRRFPRSRIHVVAGTGWPGPTLADFRRLKPSGAAHAARSVDDLAAIIFTSGSTGPPKGVAFTLGNFQAQIDQIRDQYAIQPGGRDLACFPLFALFNATMGVTTVIADLDPTRPAAADPRRLIQQIHDLQIDQSFASPAVWNRVGRHCERHQVSLPSLRRVLSAGAPVAPHIVQRVSSALSDLHCFHIPYGATEALPVATIDAAEVLQTTAADSARGAGICVGRRFPEVEWKTIEIRDDAIASIDDVVAQPCHQIGELIVRGPQVTQQYLTRVEANAWHKISDGATVWHRMGDVGYLDEQDRFWFCGRKAHRVQTSRATMYTICCEAIYNEHPRVHRSALVGIGPPGQQIPVVIIEPWPEDWPARRRERQQLRQELFELGRHQSLTSEVAAEHILLRRELPVDIRHNAKIFREQLAIWAAHRAGR